MSETPENDKQDHLDDVHDHLLVRHADGKSDKVAIPDEPEKVVRIGRELDNDVVLTDPRASRYHGELRKNEKGEVEVKDLGSANGVLLGTTRIKADSWQTVSPDQVIQMGETRLIWEKAATAQSTIAMTPAQRQRAAERTVPSAAQPPIPQPKTEEQANMPLMIGIAALVLILLGVGVAAFFVLGGGSEGEPTGVVEAPAATTEAADATAATRSDLSEQNTGTVPTPTATPSGPQLAIPVVRIDSAEVRPIILAALPSTDKALYLVQVRVQNVGNASFNISTGDFSLKTGTGQIIKEAGGTTTQEGLRRLGAVDRFDDLNLTPGGSVAESLIFELLPQTYDLELVFESPDANPVVLGLGTVDAAKELALALGTPVAEETPVAATTATPTPEPTPTATRPPAIPAPQVVPRSALVGTIAYPVFNGDTYDLYLGRIDGGGTQFYRGGASQPAFNSDGSRIA
ncbi:MAG: FHA domain-containing protein, partial [Anaerolineae bacterium]|nr:FHA domain-containing protein [Anaerolineae bacterium]